MTLTNELTNSEQTRKKLESFSHLEEGWKNGRGGPLRGRALRDAISINSYAAWFAMETDAFMGIEKDVTVALYHDGKDYSFHVSSNGAITLDSELQEILPEIGLSIADCFSKINLIASSKWKLSYFCTWLISTPDFGDSAVWRLNPLATGAESPSFHWIVSEGRALQSAPKPIATTPPLFPSRLSFGALNLTDSRRGTV
jgi:hypothetical protein